MGLADREVVESANFAGLHRLLVVLVAEVATGEGETEVLAASGKLGGVETKKRGLEGVQIAVGVSGDSVVELSDVHFALAVGGLDKEGSERRIKRQNRVPC